MTSEPADGSGFADNRTLDEALRSYLREGLVEAQRTRDHRRMGVIRSLMSAIDNAGAPLGVAAEGTAPAVGLRGTELARRDLDAATLVEILAAERAEHEHAMSLLADAGRADSTAGHATAIGVVDEYMTWLRGR